MLVAFVLIIDRVLTYVAEYGDGTVIAGYAPGDHLSKEQRNKFWKNLDKTLGEIPRRSCKIL
jgi:hypothetical protein